MLQQRFEPGWDHFGVTVQLRAVPPLFSQGPGSVGPSRGLDSGVSFWHIVGALQLCWGDDKVQPVPAERFPGPFPFVYTLFKF